jgi:hypothetical protein
LNVHLLILKYVSSDCRGARESWRKSNNQIYSVGFAVTESTSVAVKHGSPTTATAAPTKKNLVSFSGGGPPSAAIESIPQGGEKKMVKFTGGFSFAEVPAVEHKPEHEISSAAGGSSAASAAGEADNEARDTSDVVVGVSDDGCSLFSTGN